MTDQPVAVRILGFGDDSQWQILPHDPGLPGPGEVRVAIEMAGLSYADVLVAQGLYQLKPKLPFTPGSEGAGIITDVGAGVDPARVGERVCVGNFNGTMAQAVLSPADQALPLPDHVSFAQGAVSRVSYGTAYYALHQRGAVQAGESVLVLGAGGAVGQAAVQMAKAMGAFVIASASTPEKRALALACGADAVVDTQSADWRADVRAANGDKAIDVVVDPVGGDMTELAVRSLAWNGRLLVIGFVGGGIPAIRTNLLLLKGASLIGVDARQFGVYETATKNANLRAVMEMFAKGLLVPQVAPPYKLADFRTAMADAFAGKIAGRVVVEMQTS